MTRVAIFGSGFGLYGYLPALVARGNIALLNERYRGVVANRQDIRRLENLVDWVPDEEAQLAGADAAIVALRPIDQERLVERALRYTGIERLLLEKPLARDPAAGSRILKAAEMAGVIVRGGYNFHATPWGQELLRTDGGLPHDTEIVWRFRAHHYLHDYDNWKRRHSEGGGALRFYGIHLVALAAMLGFDHVEDSAVVAAESGEAESWSATLGDPAGRILRLHVDSNAPAAELRITGVGKPHSLVQLGDPYETSPPLAGFDRRTGITAIIVQEFLRSDGTGLSGEHATIALWSRIEQHTDFHVRS